LTELACPGCRYTNVCSPLAMLEWLRRAKMVRRDVQPDVELIEELFRAAARKFTCPECGTTGLIVRAAAREDDEDWGMARACDECGRPIARERLEIFPDTRLCVACEGSEDRGELTGPAEYCPRCGNLMTVRPTRTAGITRYKLACSKCRG